MTFNRIFAIIESENCILQRREGCGQGRHRNKKGRKKVEYLELIYDLIFVYIIGRNNSLLHQISGGFVEGRVFGVYVLCTLTVIQIWNFSTYYINMHGRNGLRDCPEVTAQTKRMGLVLGAEALMVFVTYPIYRATGFFLALFAVLFGVVGSMIHGKKSRVTLVDFTHLTERAMLYVVFTFGEMIIALAGYFEGGLTVRGLYFSLMSFLIVVGLFLSYGTVYDHLIDRELKCTGLVYMLLHIFLIFALSLITTSLEFMHDDEVELLPKILMLIFSFLGYYVSLFMTLRFSKTRCRPKARFFLSLAGCAASFVLLMLVFKDSSTVNIALSVIYVWGIFLLLHRFSIKTATGH